MSAAESELGVADELIDADLGNIALIRFGCACRTSCNFRLSILEPWRRTTLQPPQVTG